MTQKHEKPDIGTGFEEKLRDIFCRSRAAGILDMMSALRIPAPEGGREFLAGTEGLLIFSDTFNVVIRIEKPDAQCNMSRLPCKRIVDPNIVQPLGAVDMGFARIEICPGVEAEFEKTECKNLKEALANRGVDFWDARVPNIGRLPGTDVRVVVDRLGVNYLTRETGMIRKALDAGDPQEKQYGGLKAIFAAACNDRRETDAGAVLAFWGGVKAAKAEGRLVAGWHATSDTLTGTETAKAEKVRQAAIFYRKVEKKFNSLPRRA